MRFMAFVRRSEVTFGALRRGKRVAAPFALAALLAIPCAAEAQEAGNAEAGHAYAKKVCAECHAVERGETEILNPPPSRCRHSPGITERALAVWLKPASQHAGFHSSASRHGKRDCVHHEPQIGRPLRRRGISSRENFFFFLKKKKRR